MERWGGDGHEGLFMETLFIVEWPPAGMFTLGLISNSQVMKFTTTLPLIVSLNCEFLETGGLAVFVITGPQQ